MKKLFLSIAAIVACFSCEAQHTVTVNLSDIKGDTLVFGLIDSQFRNFEKQDKVARQNGVFTYDLQGDKARMCQISTTDPSERTRFNITVVPGEQGVLSGTLSNAKWSGSAFYQELATLEEKTDELSKQMTAITDDFYKKMNAGANRDSLQKAIMPEYNALAEKLQQERMNFIKANPKSDVAATLLMSLENPEEGYNLLDESVKTGKLSLFTDAVKAQIEAVKAQIEAEKNIAPGKMAPEFTLNDINGKPLALSSLRGKYLVLDFWGSWCGWCIKGFPEMKKYYQKYAGKFEILGIDCNDTEAKWKDAVAKNELPWKHVYCPRNNRDLMTKYAISGFPTKMIIDPEGKIVKTIVGEDPAFYTLLDELFK